MSRTDIQTTGLSQHHQAPILMRMPTLKPGQTTTLAISPPSASVGASVLLGPLGGLPRALGATLKSDGSTEASGGAIDVRVVGGGR
jgi:hypothetical protein